MPFWLSSLIHYTHVEQVERGNQSGCVLLHLPRVIVNSSWTSCQQQHIHVSTFISAKQSYVTTKHASCQNLPENDTESMWKCHILVQIHSSVKQRKWNILLMQLTYFKAQVLLINTRGCINIGHTGKQLKKKHNRDSAQTQEIQS